jgi:hypothetical protein
MAGTLFGGSGLSLGSDFGVSSIFEGFGHEAKAKGDLLEAQAYSEAAGLADLNEKFTEESTAIKDMQTQRTINKTLGQQRADVAGAGFAESGSALDLLRESSSQGALQRQVLQRQGLITEAGYREQAESYRLMSQAATEAASAEKTAATGSFISGTIKAVASVAAL